MNIVPSSVLCITKQTNIIFHKKIMWLLRIMISQFISQVIIVEFIWYIKIIFTEVFKNILWNLNKVWVSTWNIVLKIFVYSTI